MLKTVKIVRIRPMHWDWKYTKEEVDPWKIEARGQVLEQPMKAYVTYLRSSFKKSIYSPNRVLYPLKRVDWEPGGDPAKMNTQNRGKSKYKRITWDEATDIIASEITRIKEKYGPFAIMVNDWTHTPSAKVVHDQLSEQKILLGYIGGSTILTATPTSWEGWYWGAGHINGVNGGPTLGPCGALHYNVANYTDVLVHIAGDVERSLSGPFSRYHSALMQFYKKIGIKHIHINPEYNPTAAMTKGKWIPILPQTDSTLYLAIIYTWLV